MSKSSSSPLQRTGLIRDDDTIAAIATPIGVGGIGIVRLSGPLAETIAKRLFRPKAFLDRFVSHRFHYGEIVDPEKGSPVDEILLVLMRSPKTYTREDIVELHCHGGYFILQKVLDLVLREGARLAQPGEFTKRAFLNGRIDLTQAEAVIDMIRAKTTESLEIASQQLKGGLFREMVAVREELSASLAFIEAHIDFSEEEIGSPSLLRVDERFTELIVRMDEWVRSYEEGRVFREGVSCAIVGKTNVGKSSLLNVLLEQERAIVTPIPGTTRDVIEEVLNIKGVPVRLMDTAGLRRTTDSVEVEGVRRARERVADADFLLVILDGSRPVDADDREIFLETAGKKKVVVVNKTDLPSEIDLAEIESQFPEDPVIYLSALQRTGIEELKQTIYRSLIHREVRPSPEHLIVANLRHKVSLSQAREALQRAKEGLQKGISLEFIAFEIRSSLEALAEMVGETTTEEVLSRIFEQFCIGK